MKLLKTLLAIAFVPLLSITAFAGDEKKADSTTIHSTPPAAPASGEIKWLSYDEGLAKAKKEGKHLFIDFTAKWCGYCKKMDASTFISPEIVSMLNNDFVPVRIDGDSEKEMDIDGYKVTEKNLSRYEYKVRGYPTFWFLSAEGTKLGTIQGYQPAENLLSTLQYVKDKKYEKEQGQQQSQEKKDDSDKN